MSYVREVLGNGETLEYTAKISHWSFIGSYVAIAGLGFVILITLSLPGLENMSQYLALVILAIVARIAVLYYGTELALTNRRVIAKTGIIRRDTVEINLGKIEGIQISQSIPGRLLNYGTVSVTGSGTSHAPLRGIAEPLVFRKKFDEICARHRSLN